MKIFNKLEQLVFTFEQKNVILAKELAISQNFDLEQALKTKYAELITFFDLYRQHSEAETFLIDFVCNLTDEYCDITETGIVNFPKYFNLMTNLKYFYLSNNNITLNEDFFKLKALKRIYLGNCMLTEIPKEIQQFENLRVINLMGNVLKTIPKEFAKLDKLYRLFLSYNPLEDIPDEILEMKNLRVLHIIGTKIPEERLKYIKDSMPQTKVKYINL